MRRARALALLTLALLALPLAGGQPPAGENEARLHALAYHPYPDAGDASTGEQDPFGYPAVEGRDWMSATYGAYWFPTTRFDGVLEASYAVDGTISDMRQFYRRYQDLLEERAREDTPVGVRIEGNLAGGEGSVHVRLNPIATVESSKLVVRLVVFEDRIPYTGGNGVDVHRFTARATLAEESVTLRADAPVAFNRTFPLGEGWTRENLGVVAYVQNLDETAPALEHREVLQAATHRFDQEGPTLQRQKGVLLEMYTATWCPSCVYGDGAMDLLASENGQPALRDASRGLTYFRPPTALQAALGVAAGLVVAGLVTPREGGRKRG